MSVVYRLYFTFTGNAFGELKKRENKTVSLNGGRFEAQERHIGVYNSFIYTCT